MLTLDIDHFVILTMDIVFQIFFIDVFEMLMVNTGL